MMYDALDQGQISDGGTTSTVVERFLGQAAALGLDQYDLTMTRIMMRDKRLDLDGRRPGYVTRERGLAGTCKGCTDGFFPDFVTGTPIPLQDGRYEVRLAFRIIGWLLQRGQGSRSVCSALQGSEGVGVLSPVQL